MKLGDTMDRTNIIDHDEVARAMTLASPDKGKGNGKKKATEARASRPPKSHKVNTVPTARVGAKATTTPTQTPETRFYEANGLKIPLYNKAGLGNTKRQYARLSKGLLKYSLDELLGIVEQYAGADKRQELTDKRLQKSSLANWIEAKETLALGPNPKSTLSSKFIPTVITAHKYTHNCSRRQPRARSRISRRCRFISDAYYLNVFRLEDQEAHQSSLHLRQ
jgi:hypothetical protein